MVLERGENVAPEGDGIFLAADLMHLVGLSKTGCRFCQSRGG